MTDKLREAAQQALEALEQYQLAEAEANGAIRVCCSTRPSEEHAQHCVAAEAVMALRASLAQQDEHMQPAGDADMAVYRGIAANYHKDKADLTQQDEQTEQEPVAMRYDYDGYGYKYIDAGSGSDWQTRVKGAEPVFAAPTPPAQRGCSSTSHVGLTDEEIEEVVRDYMNVENGLLKVHKTLIEEYEKKNGINRG